MQTHSIHRNFKCEERVAHSRCTGSVELQKCRISLRNIRWETTQKRLTSSEKKRTQEIERSFHESSDPRSQIPLLNQGIAILVLDSMMT